jgi:hypothetical protein
MTVWYSSHSGKGLNNRSRRIKRYCGFMINLLEIPGFKPLTDTPMDLAPGAFKRKSEQGMKWADAKPGEKE